MGPCDIYSPRRFDSADPLTLGSMQLKFITISRNADAGAYTATQDEMDAIRRFGDGVMPDIEKLAPHYGLGYVVLHVGHEGRWLLIHWWIEGGVTAQIMARAGAEIPTSFTRFDPTLLACVWEQ